MPIKGLSDRGLAFPQIGSIRKGAAKNPDENKPGKDLPYFRMDFDERETAAIAKFAALYPDGKPTDIKIVLPFDDIERVWNPWREAYTAGALIHRCDGEYVNYAINPATGERVVMNWSNAQGERVKCNIQNHANKQQRCKPTGRLMVIVPELERLAYLTVHTTSIHDIGNISDQLAAIREMNGGHISGVPLILRRRPVEISTPSGTDGKRARRVKWLISIEADPEWTGKKFQAMKQAAMPDANRPQLAAPLAGPEWSDVDDENGDDDVIEGEAVVTETQQPDAIPHFEPLPADVIPQPESKPVTNVKPQRPYSPEVVKMGIDKLIIKHADKPANDKQRGLVSGMLEACFAGDIDSTDKRHSLTAYLIGVDTMKDATPAQVNALLDWVKPTKDEGGAYAPDSMAVKEAQAIIAQRMIDMGQTAMELNA